jgi:hypothetical protein
MRGEPGLTRGEPGLGGPAEVRTAGREGLRGGRNGS